VKQQILVRTAILGTAMLLLAGCDDFKSALGMDRHVPDESQVVARPALTLPPDYNLRPPGTATPVSGEHESGTTLGQAAGTPGEQSLENSAAAGAQGAPKKEERGFFGRMFGFVGDMFGDDDTAAAAAQPAAAQPAQAPAEASNQPAEAPKPPPTPSQSINGMPGANDK
jgi:hypothetical protein